MPGPQYRVSEQEDGTFVIHDVPILHAIEEGELGKGRPGIDQAWMQSALQSAQQRVAGGYEPPLFREHSRLPDGSLNDRAHRVASFRPTRMGTAPIKGEELPAVFADLVGLDDFTLDEVKSGRLPHLSVEIHNLGKAEIDGLALIPQVPQCRFPNLDKRTLTFAQFSSRQGDDGGAITLLAQLTPEALLMDPNTDTPPAGDEGGGDDIDARLGKLEEQVAALVKSMAGAQADLVPGEPDPVQNGSTPVDPDDVNSAAQLQATVGALEGRLLALEEGNQKRSANEAASARLSAALADDGPLAGRNLSDATRDRLAQLSAQGDKVFSAAVEALAAETQPDPGNLDDLLSGRPGGTQLAADVPELAPYAAQGAEVLGRARQCHRAYLEAKQHRFHGGMSLEDWLKTNLARTAES